MRDAVLFEQYRSQAQATIAQYGGRYIVRGGSAELVEGSEAKDDHLGPDTVDLVPAHVFALLETGDHGADHVGGPAGALDVAGARLDSAQGSDDTATDR